MSIVYIFINGGLGNQLFQLATALEYCNKYNLCLKIITGNDNSRPYYWNSLLKSFSDIVETSPVPKEILLYEEPGFSFTEIPSPPLGENIILKGCFQSPKYFPQLVATNFLSFPINTEKYILNKYGNIFGPDCAVIHARRGDYLKLQEIHRPLTENYYLTAIAAMKASKYILISDDPEFWNSDRISFGKAERIAFNEDEMTTLYLMSKSKNIVIANSTFSWWGAFLAGPEANVIAPAIWFGPAGPSCWKDIYMSNWTII